MMRRLDLNEPEYVQMGALVAAISENGGGGFLYESPQGTLCSPRSSTDELVDLPAETLGSIFSAWIEPGVYERDSEMKEVEWRARPSIPIRLVKSYMGKRDYPGIPRIVRTVRAPLVRPDLSVTWDHGMDHATGCWVTSGAVRDDSLSLEDAMSVFAPFAFAHSVSIADCVAMALTPYLTTVIDGAYPGLLVTGRQPGSGKTQLVQVIGVLANNELTPVQSWKRETEMRKAITTSLNDGDRFVLYDNVKSSIDSPEFEAVLTSRRWKDRAMQTHRGMRLRNDTTWTVTRNNPDLSSDMARRMVVVLLDKHANPTPWDHSTLPRALSSANALVTAMIRMIEVWRDAGAPPGSVSFSGFEEWSQMVSGILEANGVTGFLSARNVTLEDAVSTEDDDDAEIVRRIALLMGEGTRWTAGDLWDKVHSVDYSSFVGGAGADLSLLRAWLDARGAGVAEPAKSIGRRLSALVGRHFDTCEYVLEKVSRSYVINGIPALKRTY